MNRKQSNRTNRKINTKVKKKLRPIKKKIRKIIRKIKKKVPSYIGAASIKNFKKDFQVLTQTGNTMRVKGRDLVYSIPESLSSDINCNIITVIPANPAYWSGTRISAIASGYQNYRPIKFKITYVPQCAVTQQGNVLCGTLWSMSPKQENLQQTLRTSNGGMLTQCYRTKTISVQLKKNLQYNLFRMGGEFNQQSNPFIFIGMAIACTDQNSNKIVPGYFYITYEYELKNPIGNTITYFNSNIVTKTNDYDSLTNLSCVVCDSNNCPTGTILSVDDNKYYYNDEEKQLQDDDYVWYFGNNDGDISINKTPVAEKLLGYGDITITNYLELTSPTNSQEEQHTAVAITDKGSSIVNFVVDMALINIISSHDQFKSNKFYLDLINYDNYKIPYNFEGYSNTQISNTITSNLYIPTNDGDINVCKQNIRIFIPKDKNDYRTVVKEIPI